MGTTIVTALLDGDEWVVGNVGDSRAYHYTGRSVRQVTVDHSLVQEMVDEGRLTRGSGGPYPSQYHHPGGGNRGDRPWTPSGGLVSGRHAAAVFRRINEHVSDQEIARVLAGRGTADRKVRTRIAMANKRGGRDNITVALAVCGQEAIH
jgi:protein phosphatase